MNESMALGASVVSGVAATALSWAVLQFAWRPPPIEKEEPSFEDVRQRELRQGNTIYAVFEPAVREVIPFVSGSSKSNAELQRLLAASAEPLPWAPDEFRAIKLFESVLVALAAAIFTGIAFDWVAASGALVMIGMIYYMAALSGLKSKANKRLKALRIQMPSSVDLMALMMEAGASFLEALAAVVAENRDNPLGEEFGLVVREIELGRPREEALEALHLKLRDDDVTEWVFAVTKGEELGTPLSQTLRTQADQMRLKRTQWAEKAAAEAGVKIVFPGMIVMLACLLIIAAPFVLQAVYSR